MGKLFSNLGFMLMIGLAIAIGLMFTPYYNPVTAAIGIFQWLHVIFGITWIGLNLNLAQSLSLPPEEEAGASAPPAAKGLSALRWSAALTVLSGLTLAYLYDELFDALTLAEGTRLIGIGMWIALIMASNVWFIIWPNQKRAFGLVPADRAAKLKAARTAMIAARFNTMLTVPMLLAMVAYR
jgi:uncharacterized membrane protein